MKDSKTGQPDESLAAIKQTSSRKFTGRKCLPTELFTHGGHHKTIIVKLLVQLYNTFWKLEYEDFKGAIIVSCTKEGCLIMIAVTTIMESWKCRSSCDSNRLISYISDNILQGSHVVFKLDAMYN